MSRAKPRYGYYALGYYLLLIGATFLGGVVLGVGGQIVGSSTLTGVGVAVLIYGVVEGGGLWLGVYVLPEGRVRRAARVAASLSDGSVTRLLDVGSGRGIAMIEFAKRFAASRAVSVDIWQRGSRRRLAGYDPTAPVFRHTVARTRENARIEGVADRVNFLTSDATRLSLADDAFDLATCSYLLFHLHAGRFRRDDTPRRRCLWELRRVLRPGGRLVIFELVTTGWVNLLAWTPIGYLGMRLLSKPLTLAYWENLLRDAGFRIEHAELRRGNVVLVARRPEVPN